MRTYHNPETDADEHIFYMWHFKHGVLFIMDSYHGSRNSAKIYFNWEPIDEDHCKTLYDKGVYYNGGFIDKRDSGSNIMEMHIDVRCAMEYMFNVLKENGHFVTPWVEAPFLWPLAWWDEDEQGQYDNIRNSLMAEFWDKLKMAEFWDKLKLVTI